MLGWESQRIAVSALRLTPSIFQARQYQFAVHDVVAMKMMQATNDFASLETRARCQMPTQRPTVSLVTHHVEAVEGAVVFHELKQISMIFELRHKPRGRQPM